MIVPFIAISRYVLQNKCRPQTLQRNEPFRCFIRCDNGILRQFQTFNNKSYFLNEFYHQLKENVPFVKSSLSVLLWANQIQLIPRFLKSSSVSVVRNCLEQVEFVLAYRIRRGQQMISLYARLWDERALKHFFHSIRRMFHKRGSRFVIGASLLAFDWDYERIPDVDLKKHLNELDICHALRNNVESYQKQPTICKGTECKCPQCFSDDDVHCWEPFIQEEDLTVWKMEETNHKGQGLYCYKMYGRYKDVAANDFLAVFLDTENRTKWDSHAATLKVIDTEPSSNSDVIYWETKWPSFFSNRDYVFKRRFIKDRKSSIIIIMNKSTEHPLYPPLSSKSRVTEYWSYMVIKSQESDFNKPGIEFSLTYFDNPGIALPSAISLWITVQGMPEYLKRLRLEAIAMKDKRKDEPDVDDEEKVCGQAPIKTSNEGKSEPPSNEPPFPEFDPSFIYSLLSSYMNKLKQSSL